MTIALDGDFKAAPHTGGSFFGRLLRNMQKARMRSVLNQMSDRELGLIGVKRGEIDSYAAKLVDGE